MKMSKELFSRLEKAIQQVFKEITTLEKYKESHPSFSLRRIRWDFSFAAKRFDPNLFSDMYAEGLNDNHIDTALRLIIK